MARKTKGGRAALIAQRVNAQMKSNVVTMGSDVRYTIRRVPTGVMVLDRIMHGGFARGRHVELYGDFLVGKSLVFYLTMALAQQRGEVCALIDTEGVFDARWFAELGGNPEELIMGEPENANTLGNVIRALIQKTEEIDGVDIVGIDSVAALLPREEQEHDLSAGDARVASLSRLMSLLLRQLTMQNKDTLFLWTNQWRDKISSIPGLKSTPGGLSLGYYASQRLEMRAGEKENADADVVYKAANVKRKRVMGRWVNCRLSKEKTGARPEDTCSFLLDYETRRPDELRQIIDLGMRDELIVRRGDYYHIVSNEDGDEVKVHGIRRATKLLAEEDELREFLVDLIEMQTAELGTVNG